MKKKILTLLPFLLVSCSALACTPKVTVNPEPEPDPEPPIVDPVEDPVEDPIDDEPPVVSNIETYGTRRETSLLGDACFNGGFILKSPETTNVYIEKTLDWNGQATRNPSWYMAQWWTPFNFKDAPYRDNGGSHFYQNESRSLEVDTNTGKLTMQLNAYEEYKEKFNGKRNPEYSWSHFLIEQNFPEELVIKMGEVENLFVEFDVTINYSHYLDEGIPLGTDCAQLLFYLRLYNDVPADSDPEEVGTRNRAMWFGLPIWDSRYDSVALYAANDEGFTGATNSLIYSIPSKTYMGAGPVQMGKTYHISLDVYDYIKEAFIYGYTKNFMKNCLWQNLACKYMNFGFEIPGQYDVSATIENLDIYVDPDLYY